MLVFSGREIHHVSLPRLSSFPIPLQATESPLFPIEFTPDLREKTCSLRTGTSSSEEGGT